MTIIPQMELPRGNCPSLSPTRRGQMPLAYPRPTHSMSLRSHDWVPPHSESPDTPGTSIFERAMRRSNYARDRTPDPDNIEDVDYECSPDPFQTSPCARLGDCSLILSEDNTSTVGGENETHPTGGWYFDIRQDSPERKSPSPSTPRSYGGMNEDKENILPTESDWESPIQNQARTDNAGFNGLNNPQHDAFGITLIPYADALAELSVNRYGYPAPPASIFAYDPVPTEPARSPERMELDEEDEIRGERRADWRRVLDDDHIRELQRLTDVFSGGLEQQALHNVHYAIPDERFRGFSSIFMEDRLVTEHRRRRNRGHNSEGEEN